MRPLPKNIDELIEKPNCNLACEPGNEYECCKGCGIMFETIKASDEYVTRFAPSVIKEIFSYWVNDTDGFLNADGCVLPRKYRPICCLTHICNYFGSKK